MHPHIYIKDHEGTDYCIISLKCSHVRTKRNPYKQFFNDSSETSAPSPTCKLRSVAPPKSLSWKPPMPLPWHQGHPRSSFSFNNFTTLWDFRSLYMFHQFSTSQLSNYGAMQPFTRSGCNQTLKVLTSISALCLASNSSVDEALRGLCDTAGWNGEKGWCWWWKQIKVGENMSWKPMLTFSLMICLGLLWWVYVDWLLIGSPLIPMLGHILHNTSCSHDTFGSDRLPCAKLRDESFRACSSFHPKTPRFSN